MEYARHLVHAGVGTDLLVPDAEASKQFSASWKTALRKAFATGKAVEQRSWRCLGGVRGSWEFFWTLTNEQARSQPAGITNTGSASPTSGRQSN